MRDSNSIYIRRNLAVIQPTSVNNICNRRVVLDKIKLNLRRASRKVNVQTAARRQIQVVARERGINQAASRRHVHGAQQHIEIEAAVRKQSWRRKAAASRQRIEIGCVGMRRSAN